MKKIQCICGIIDTQQRHSFRSGKTKFRQRIHRIFSAEIFANHLQAGYATLHRIMLMCQGCAL